MKNQLFNSNNHFIKARDITYTKAQNGLNKLEFVCKTNDVNVGETINGEYEVKTVTKETEYGLSSIYAESILYNLMNKAFIETDPNAFNYTESSFEYANIDLQTIINKLNSLTETIGFRVINRLSYELTANLSFSEDNCLSALQKIIQAYEIEFRFQGNKDSEGYFVIDIFQRAGTVVPALNLMVGRDINTPQISIDNTEIITKLYPTGSNEGIPSNYIYNSLKPTKFYPINSKHGGINPIPSDVSIVIQFKNEEGNFPEVLNGATKLSDSRWRFVGKDDYVFQIKYPRTSKGIIEVLDITETIVYFKEKYDTMDITEDFYSGDLIWYFDLQKFKFDSQTSTPDFSFTVDSPYGIIERSQQFDVKPEILKSRANLIHFDYDDDGKVINGYVETFANWVYDLDHYQVRFVQQPTLRIVDRLITAKGLGIKFIVYGNGTTTPHKIYFYPPKEDTQKNIEYMRVNQQIDSDDFMLYIEDYIWIKQYEEAGKRLKSQALSFLENKKQPKIELSIDSFTTENEFDIGDNIKIIDKSNPLQKIISKFEQQDLGNNNLDIQYWIDEKSPLNASQMVGNVVKDIIRYRLSNNTTEYVTGQFKVIINDVEESNILYEIAPNSFRDYYIFNGIILRITQFSYTPETKQYQSIQTTNQLAFNPRVNIVTQLISTKNKVKEQSKQIQNSLERNRELKRQYDLLVKSAFKGIETDYVVVGDPNRNLMFDNLVIDRSPAVDGGHKGIVKFSEGSSFEMILPDDNQMFGVNGTSFTLTDTNPKYIYIKIQKASPNINGDVELNTSADKSGSQGAYTWYLIGVLKGKNYVANGDNFPVVVTNYGLTLINGNEIITDTITADKISSLILEANKYIQSGTENDGYRLHGTYGLQRLKNQNVFNIPSIMAKSSVSLGTDTSKIITLPFALTSYDVNLNLTKFKYWDSGFQTNQNRDLIVSWDYISSTQFKINAYTQVSNTYVTVNQKIYIPDNNTYTDLYQTSNCVNAKVALGNSYSHNENYVYSHTYITAGSYLIKLKRVFAYGTYYIWTIDWGDGSTQLLQGIEGNIGYAYMLGYYQGTIIQSANAEIQYAVIGY